MKGDAKLQAYLYIKCKIKYCEHEMIEIRKRMELVVTKLWSHSFHVLNPNNLANVVSCTVSCQKSSPRGTHEIKWNPHGFTVNFGNNPNYKSSVFITDTHCFGKLSRMKLHKHPQDNCLFQQAHMTTGRCFAFRYV